MVAAVYVNLRSYTSYISRNGVKTLRVRLLRGFGGFSVLCKVFSSGALLHIRQKDRIPTPNPIPERSSPTRSLSPREGSVDGWGEHGLRSSLLAFKTKWRKKGQKQVSPRQRLGNCSQPTFAQNGQKNYYFVHSLCHSAVVGCYSFAPFGGVSMLHPLPPGVARGWHINAPFGA